MPPELAFEQRRLADLHSLNILDTAFEERFDRYTSLISSLFQFPICLISMVDDHRQWFKSSQGLDFRETSRDRSFCAHALAQTEVFVVPDTLEDERFVRNPLVTGHPYIRFYAGAVIHGPRGLPLGTLCVLDHKPRSFNSRQCQHLRQFAELVDQELLAQYRIEQATLAARYEAHHDPLTDLPNQKLFSDRLNQFVQMASNRPEFSFTVLHIDVVDFLSINRSLGRETGDVILRELARRLSHFCPVQGSVARLHSDRFALVAPEDRYSDEGPATLVCQLARELSRPVYVGAHEQFLRLRIGASVCRGRGGASGENLLEQAASAARFGGDPLVTGVSVHFHDPLLESRLRRRFDLISRLRSALAHEQFHLVFQPVFEVAGSRPVSMEALIRWHEPELGLIPPDEFIPLAEATGLILPIGHWVLNQALGYYRQWLDQGLSLLPVQVNVSARELDHPDFVSAVCDLLSHYDLPGKALCLEMTETVLIQDLEINAAKMARLTELGVSFYIDDFGKGYSSLQYLRKLPFTALKIDRSFISHITDNTDDEAIARAVIDLGRSLGVTVIAEGVESEGQMAFLREAGCPRVQGFLLARPLEAGAMGALLRD